jgi:glutamine synthetase
MSNKKIVDYFWLDKEGLLRTKTKILNEDEIPGIWNYDGSSTGQASIEGNTEIIIKPVITIQFNDNYNSYIAFCDIFDIDNNPLSYRQIALNYFEREDVIKEEPWFGLEQEFYFVPKYFYENFYEDISKKNEYCSINRDPIERKVMTEFIDYCINTANIGITGINSEVSPHQWEFQIFGKGIKVCDEFYVARIILEILAEKNGLSVCYLPKIHPNISGSGCHVNFSTNSTRRENGYNTILEYSNRFKNKHLELIGCCSELNKERLSGKFETAKWDTFTWGIGTRNTSIRIPNDTFKNGCGYLEDRRPGADIDPYLYLTTMCKIALNNDK